MSKVSLILTSFMRAPLLDLGLKSISKYKTTFPLEIVVVNDGPKDDTEAVCKKYSNILDIKYIFSGIRNINGIIKRNPAVPANVGIKNSAGQVLILSCPEMYHVNACINYIVPPLFNNKRYLVTPEHIYFDNTNEYTKNVFADSEININVCEKRKDSPKMPFLIGMYKEEIVNIGGYDEDYNDGYAGEDNDLMNRLLLNGCKYTQVPAEVVHLYHGERCDSKEHWENPKWVYSRSIKIKKQGSIIRNIGRPWGEISYE